MWKWIELCDLDLLKQIFDVLFFKNGKMKFRIAICYHKNQ